MTSQPHSGSPNGDGGKWTYVAHFPEPPQSLFTETPPPPPYPIPDSMAPAAQELMRITGGADRLAALALQAAYNAVALHWYGVTGERTDYPRPIGLFIFAGEESASGKTMILNQAFAAHYEADDAAYRRWEEARQEGKKKRGQSVEGGVSLAADDLQQPPTRKMPPTMIADDFTAEKLLERLSRGRPSQIAMTSEATAVSRNFSFKAGNRSQGMSTLNRLYDGFPISHDRVHQGGPGLYLPAGYAFGLCWFAQPDPARSFVLSNEAADGFASRCLFAVSDTLQVGEPEVAPTPNFDRMQDTLRYYLARQNVGVEYDSGMAAERVILRPAPGVAESLKLFVHDCRERRERARSRHARSFWGRAGENTARVAGNIRVSELFSEGAGDATWDEHDLEQAMAIITWHGDQMDAHTESNDDTEMAKLAAAVAAALPQGVWWEDGSTGAKRPDGLTIPMLTWMQHAHIPDARLKNETRKKYEIVDLLVQHGFVARVSGHKGSHGGRYAVSPWIL